MPDSTIRLRRHRTDDLTAGDVDTVRKLLRTAFAGDGEGFTDADWDHAVGGLHVLCEVDGLVVAHAALVERELHVGGRPILTGYVEAVATDVRRQGQGLGSLVMTEIGSAIGDRFALGALSTDRTTFYARLGWQQWTGPTSVRTGAGPVRTPDDDGGIMILLTPTSPDLDPNEPISCDWRTGDVW